MRLLPSCGQSVNTQLRSQSETTEAPEERRSSVVSSTQAEQSLLVISFGVFLNKTQVSGQEITTLRARVWVLREFEIVLNVLINVIDSTSIWQIIIFVQTLFCQSCCSFVIVQILNICFTLSSTSSCFRRQLFHHFRLSGVFKCGSNISPKNDSRG